MWKLLTLLLIVAVAQAAQVTEANNVTLSGPFVLDAETETWVTEQSTKIFRGSDQAPFASPVAVGCWRRYDLSAPTSDRGKQLWFVLHSLERRTEALLVVNERVIESAAAGYAVPINQRTIPVLDLALPLSKWRTGGTAAVYVRFPMKQPPTSMPTVRDPTQGVQAQFSAIAFDFAYFGAFAVILIVRCGFFAFYRDRATRDYVFLTIGLMVGVVARAGYWDVYLAPSLGSTLLLGDFRYLIRILNSVLAWRTVSSFFDFRRTAPRLDRAMRASTWTSLALVVIVLFLPSLFRTALSGIVQLQASILVATGCFIGIRRQLPGAYSFSLGWIGIVLLTGLISAHALGLPGAIDQESLTRLTILALLWENTVNTIVITFRFRNLQIMEHLAAVRGQQSVHRQQLLKLLTHDIANPAAAIKTSVWLLRRSIDNLDTAKSIENADRIDAGVTEIFEIVSRVRTLEVAPGESIKLDPVNVVEIVHSTLEGFHARFAAKGLVVNTRFESKEVIAYADKVLLASSVLANALSNAIKFTQRAGTIEVNVSTAEDSVLIVIRDFGVGISAEDRHKLETLVIPLQSRPGTEQEEGTGFGLQLMAHAVQQMGGALAVRSQTAEDKQGPAGTTVVISLKMVPKTARPQRNVTAAVG